MKRMMTIATVAVGLVALLTVGCGGSSDDENTATDGDTSGPMTDTMTPADTNGSVADTTVAPPPQDTTTLPPPMDTGAPPTTTATCVSVLECVNQCNPSDIQACMAACLGAAPTEVQQQFNTMVQCQQGCPGEQQGTVDIECMAATCYPAAHACLGNPGQELGCADVLQCINTCPQTEQACPTTCLFSAKDKASFDAFFAIVDCIGTACPTEPGTDPNDPAATACVNAATAQGGACYSQLATCVGPMPGGKPGIFLYQRFFQWLMDWNLLVQPIH